MVTISSKNFRYRPKISFFCNYGSRADVRELPWAYVDIDEDANSEHALRACQSPTINVASTFRTLLSNPATRVLVLYLVQVLVPSSRIRASTWNEIQFLPSIYCTRYLWYLGSESRTSMIRHDSGYGLYFMLYVLTSDRAGTSNSMGQTSHFYVRA